MSYKDGYKTELATQTQAAPAGSMAPLTSTQDGGKWHHGIGAAELSALSKISTEVADIFEKGVRDHVRMQIGIGRLLNEARVLIPGDLQFGQWRAANTPINSKTTANKLMNLAKQVGDGRITQQMVDGLHLSNLKELLTAPDSVLGEVTAKLEAGETLRRDDIRELKAAENTPGTAPDGSPGATTMLDDLRATDEDDAPEKAPGEAPKAAPQTPQAKGPSSPAGPPRVTPASQIPSILSMTLIERVRRLDPDRPPYDGCKPEEWAWLVMGLDPNPAYYPGTHVIEILGVEYGDLIEGSGAHDTDRLQHTLQRAEKITRELCESEM